MRIAQNRFIWLFWSQLRRVVYCWWCKPLIFFVPVHPYMNLSVFKWADEHARVSVINQSCLIMFPHGSSLCLHTVIACMRHQTLQLGTTRHHLDSWHPSLCLFCSFLPATHHTLRVKHPNILQLVDVFETKKEYFLFLELWVQTSNESCWLAGWGGCRRLPVCLCCCWTLSVGFILVGNELL